MEHLCIYQYNDNIFIFQISFIISVFMYKISFANFTNFFFTQFLVFVCKWYRFYISKLSIFVAFSLKDIQNFFMQSSSLFTPRFFSIPLHFHIVEIEYPQGLSFPTFAANNFSELLFHSSIILIKNSRFA